MRNSWSGQSLPHPPGRRRLHGDIEKDVDPRTPVQNLMRRLDGLPPLFEIRAYRERFVFAGGAELSGQVCDDATFDKALAPAVRTLRTFAADGLFTAYTHERNWQVAHDLLVPAFSRPAMRGYHETMNAVADDFVAKWSAAEGPVDVSGDLTRMTLETIGRTAFGHSFGTFATQQTDPYVVAMVDSLRYAQLAAALWTLPLGPVFTRRQNRRTRDIRGRLGAIPDAIIAERVALGPREVGEDLLGRMLYHAHAPTGARLDAENIRSQILTFLTAGHETTSGAVSFALWFLTRHPDVLARAQAETEEILGPNPDARPSFEQVPKFRYLRRVLDETLRLWPTAPGFARTPRAPTTVGGYAMMPGDWLIVFLPGVHRDPGVWGPYADRFDPDNFLPERVRARPAHAYRPFGTGMRACIGRQFAIHEAVLVLARLVHRFELTADAAYDLAVTERLTLMPTGFGLTVRPRVRVGQPA
ncbi:MAG: cytochrome P450 [Tetrasphaera sp.]